MNKEDINEQMFAGLNKENPFRVPEGYFDDLAVRIRNGIPTNKDAKQKHTLISLKPYAAAAVLLIIALIGGTVLINRKSADNREQFQSEISQLIETELYSIPEETIIEVMSTEYSGTSTDNNDEAIEYLLNENINETELTNAL
jgi:hypothetical protein